MPIQTINLGNYANDGTGDDLRTAFTKVNENFAFVGTTAALTNGTNLGTGVRIFKQRNATDPLLEFRTLTSTDNSVEITFTAEEVNLKNKSTLANDPTPTLGANLNLSTYHVYGGDVQTTVFGIDLRVSTALVELMFASNSVTIDFGTFLAPGGGNGMPGNTGTPLDLNGTLLNGFVGTPVVGNIDFGYLVV